MMGGGSAMAPARYRQRSPIHRVDRSEGRLLIVPGADDPNVTRKPENLRVLDARLIAFFGDVVAD